jgi:peptide-methionine (S)-S-oxide reductase
MHLGGLFIGLSSYYDATLHSAARLRGILATMKKTAVVLGLLLAMGSSGAHQESPDRQAAKATFAGGCFWCMEEAFEKVEGVSSVISGYAGGSKANPTYKEVSAGRTGHTEAIEVIYDPESVGYRQLLQVFWRNIDPTDGSGQFCDKGSQYRSAVFYHDEEQKRLIEESKKALDESKPFDEPIVTEILPASMFYPAEEYHQDYYKRNPIRYRYYKYGCGRTQRLKELWGPEK